MTELSGVEIPLKGILGVPQHLPKILRRLDRNKSYQELLRSGICQIQFSIYNFHFFLILNLSTQTCDTNVFRVLLFGGLFCLFLYYTIRISHRNNSKHKENPHFSKDEARASCTEFIILMIYTICGYPHILSTILKKNKTNPN